MKRSEMIEVLHEALGEHIPDNESFKMVRKVLDALKLEELRAEFDSKIKKPKWWFDGVGPFELTAVGHKFTDEDFKAPRPFAKRIVYLVPGQELKVTFDASPAASNTETK